MFLLAGENVQLLGTATTSYWSPLRCDVIPATVPTDVYSRVVFIGGLPPDIDEGTVRRIFVFSFLCIFNCAFFFNFK